MPSGSAHILTNSRCITTSKPWPTRDGLCTADQYIARRSCQAYACRRQSNRVGSGGRFPSNSEIHGGPLRVSPFITSEGIEELVVAGFPLHPRSLDENITTQGLYRREMRLGQRRWMRNSVLVEFTKMHAPRNTLTPFGRGLQVALYDELIKANDPASPRWGGAAVYAKVFQTGTVASGDVIRLA